jgi:ribonuclease R
MHKQKKAIKGPQTHHKDPKINNNSKTSQLDTFTGIIDINSKGVGFLEVEGREEDIEIQNERLNLALDKDEVEVRLLSEKVKDREQGEVTKILKLSKRTFVGVLNASGQKPILVPDNRKMYKHIVVTEFPTHKTMAELDGNKALVEITNWTDSTRDPEGKIISLLGKKGDHEAEMQSIILDKGFESKYPEDVEREAEKIEKSEKPIPENEIAKRKDMRGVLTCTIDPVDAKDFDDAISFKELGKNTSGHELYEIGVHIADVSHYVRPGTALDDEAKNRGFSVYLVDRTIPMLPEVLSNDLCSLNPHEDKLAFSAIFEIDETGRVLKRWFGKTIINSDNRFSYEGAQDILDKDKNNSSKNNAAHSNKHSSDKDKVGNTAEAAAKFLGPLTTLNKIAKILQTKKFAAGAIDFDTEEVKFELDKNGKPIRVFKKQRLDTHKLVEEYMLLANREVAEFIDKHIAKKIGSDPVFIYRIHDLPDQDRLANLSIFAKALGFHMPHGSKISADDISKLLKQVTGTTQESLIKTAAIRSMAKAVYSTRNIGHFGLAFKYYTHFTSPIRRYADLLVHRLLESHLDGTKINSNELASYQRTAVHITEKEIAAADAERSSIKYKQVEFMSEKIGQTFKGTITGVTEWGVYVEDEETKCEGMVSVRALSDDYYELHEKQYALVGRKNKKRYTLGDKVNFKIIKTDLYRKTIDCELI